MLKFDSEPSTRVLLWDIDGTLIRIKRPNSSSPHKNVLLKRGHAFDPSVVGLSGRTDFEVFQELTKGELDRNVLSMAFKELDEESRRLDEISTFDLYPGVQTALKTLASKLEKVGIEDNFSKNLLFGCEFGDSRELIARRAREFLGLQNFSTVVVVGDTPSDINAARFSDFPVICVATGNFSVSELLIHKPDLLLRDLSADADILENFLRSLT